MTAFYNDSDANCVAWTKNLIAAGLVPPGDADGRRVEQLTGADLRKYTQIHLFQGCCGWPLALRLAGWPDDRRVWTGSCPCPPFSSAGRKKCKLCSGKVGFVGDEFGCLSCPWRDPRHLWPHMRRLVAESEVECCFGEQVASRDGREWLARVQADLEGMGFVFGAADLCSAGVKAPNVRPRLFWVAHRPGPGRRQPGGRPGEGGRPAHEPDGLRAAGAVGEPDRPRRHRGGQPLDGEGRRQGQAGAPHEAAGNGPPIVNGRMDDAERQRTNVAGAPEPQRYGAHHGVPVEAGADGFWDAFALVFCTDGMARRVEPGLECLAPGIPTNLERAQSLLEAMGFSPKQAKRMLKKPRSILSLAGRNRNLRLRGYGNAINPVVAAEFVRAFLGVEAEGYAVQEL